MASRLTGALLRAFIVAALVVAPSLLVPGLSADAQQTIALVALFAAGLTYVEYRAEAPGLIEFRDAPPFNRTRFALLALTILALSLIERGRELPSTLTDLVTAIGMLIGQAMDFPYSPVRLATEGLADTATAAEIAIVRTAAGTAYLTTLLGLFVFSFLMRRNWPRPGRAFNVWVNLPTFDPTSVSDIVARLERDARINISLGFLLPFLMPALVQLTLGGLDPAVLTAPHTLIWMMAAWAFLPASLFMRGIAMMRLAQMIRDKLRANAALAARGVQPA
ncbi:hypothetical protein [Tabrizicola sp. TH137]|uniref:hypothetical protein n=1 Tax=Tabrizicola sp. TH137 TaxID=2067452 RepID=UPI00156E26FC|nr:hypothetical protein [Tabrizicola sp. TH137]